MQGSELLQEGLALMGLGMGFVFVFLTILVISVTLMSKLIDRFQPAPVAAPAPGPIPRGEMGRPFRRRFWRTKRATGHLLPR